MKEERIDKLKIIPLWNEYFDLSEQYPNEVVKLSEVHILFKDVYDAINKSLGYVAIQGILKEINDIFKVIKGEIDE